MPRDARGALRGPWGHGSRSRHRLAPPGLGCPPHTWPQSSAEVGVFWCFFNFSLEGFWEMHLARSPRARRMRLRLSPGCFPSSGVVFPQAGNLRLEICDNNWNGESVSECTPA